MKIHNRTRLIAIVLSMCACSVAHAALFRHKYTIADFNYSLSMGNYAQAAKRLELCAYDPKNRDSRVCADRLSKLDTGISVEQALRDEAQGRIDSHKQLEMTATRIANMRASNNPWDKYILFSELSAGTIEPIDSDESSRVASEAFAGFGDCAKTTDPSCMGMYGELILRGMGSLDGKTRDEARRKALYWLRLAARYGYDPARKALVSEGEDIPTPDLAMEQLQREANLVARDSFAAQERQRRDQAIQQYQMIREQRRQTEQMIWANLFPKMINCTSNVVGTYTYTNCH